MRDRFLCSKDIVTLFRLDFGASSCHTRSYASNMHHNNISLFFGRTLSAVLVTAE